MKRLGFLLVLTLFLGGCDSSSDEIQRGMALRTRILQGECCSFTAEITADYGDKIQKFSLECQGDRQGNLAFTITKPDTISGITGEITAEGGKLTFDDTALFFELMTDDQISPACAPWIFLRTLRGGYLSSACMEENQLHLTIDDTYAEDALKLDIWMDEQDMPVRAEILHDGRRILTLTVKGFAIS